VDHPAGQFPAGVGAVAAAAGQGGRVDDGPGGGVEQQQVGRLTGSERAAVTGQPADGRGAHRHPVGHALPVEQAGLDHRLDDDGERLLQAEHPGPGRGPLALLVLHGVGRVVGGDGVDRAVGQALP
jgi:hypothetical protein